MTIRVVVTVIYSKEFHFVLVSFMHSKLLKNILLELNHTFHEIEHKIDQNQFRMELSLVDHC